MKRVARILRSANGITHTIENSILYILNKPFKEIKKYISMIIYICLVKTLTTVWYY